VVDRVVVGVGADVSNCEDSGEVSVVVAALVEDSGLSDEVGVFVGGISNVCWRRDEALLDDEGLDVMEPGGRVTDGRGRDR
jgi:hypothetical protein